MGIIKNGLFYNLARNSTATRRGVFAYVWQMGRGAGVSDEEITRLKSHSIMLGQIASCVEDFSESSNDTTLICVLRLLARYHDMKADRFFEAIRKQEEVQG